MKSKLWSLAALAMLLLVSPSQAQSIGEKTGINAAIGVSPSTSDFVSKVAISDMFEIEASKLAAKKGDRAVQAFAKEMISAHTKTSTELKSLISAGKVKADLPAKLDDTHEGKLDRLNKLNGVDFNRQYKNDQVSAHKDAVSLFERYAKGGENPELKNWAAKTLPELQKHLKMAEELDRG